MATTPWHLLQISDVLDIEFGNALAESVPVLAWKPQRTFLPWRIPAGVEHVHTPAAEAAPALQIRSLPLVPGFARFPLAELLPTGRMVAARLLRQTDDPTRTPLVCTTPFFAPVAELWPGPVVYWLTDLIAAYPSADRARVERLDRRLGKVATLLCPNSERLSTYLVERAGCDPRRIEVVPNATRAINVQPAAPDGPGPRPADIAELAGPVAGVIGNLAGNMDWALLTRAMERTPWLQWVFVGPTSMAMADRAERSARDAAMALPNARFVGRKPYGELASYARSFDVAVLPYRRHEPTYSGSSTRFYEHLTACRPMLATRGLAELSGKVPLLTLCDTAAEMVGELECLRAQGFDDGLGTLRWRASLSATWQARARCVQDALADRLLRMGPRPQASPVQAHTDARALTVQ